MEHRSHFFFAVRIPEQTKLRMKEHIEKIKERIPFSRWVHYQDLHITLAFLGSAPPDKLKQAENKFKKHLKMMQAFTLKINKLGFFGSVDSPRVFWADTEESNDYNQLEKRYFPLVRKQGFSLKQDHFGLISLLLESGKGNNPFQNGTT